MAISVALIWRAACASALLSAALWASTLSAQGPALGLLDWQNQPLVPAKQALGISRRITHDSSLPRSGAAGVESSDPEAFRIELLAPSEQRQVVYARLETLNNAGERHGLLRHVALTRLAGTAQFRSPFLRLVSDATDSSAPDVSDQLVRAQLGDRLRVSLSRTPSVPSVTYSVGESERYDPDRSLLQGTLRIAVLKLSTDGPPAVGDNAAQALILARRQVEIANEIWAQCFIHFGSPKAASVRVVAPPPPALLSVADLDGFPTRDAARVNFQVNGKQIGPLDIPAKSSPERTATLLSRALRAAGFSGEVTSNPRAELGSDNSADVVVRDARGELVKLSAAGDQPISSDPQQVITIGSVDLTDGLDEFDNTLAATGTLEERTLVKLLADDDPATIDVFLVNRFFNRARQGEAFIEADGSSMANTLIFDRNAVRFERQAWVQSHELGHILLDEAFHPDNIGADRPWLLMDADARQGRVVGPKRVSDEECKKARRRSGPSAFPPILRFLGAAK